MQRAKHRAARRPSADSAVLATTLVERLAAGSRPVPGGARHGVATLPARPADAVTAGRAASGAELFGGAARVEPMLAVPGAEAPADVPGSADGSLFGAARHAAPSPAAAFPAPGSSSPPRPRGCARSRSAPPSR